MAEEGTRRLSKTAVVVLSTAGSPAQGRVLARTLLQKRLAGCVNLIHGIDSRYWWKKKLERSRETLLLIKTSRSLLPKMASTLKKAHPYEVPEILALPVQWGDRNYLAWLAGEVAVDK